MCDAVLRLLADESAKTPLMLVLDDRHAADVPSVELLRLVARGLRPTRILVVVIQREVEARIRPEIGESVAQIARDGETLVVARLGPADVAAWLEEERKDTHLDVSSALEWFHRSWTRFADVDIRRDELRGRTCS